VRILQTFDFLSLPKGGGTVDIVYKLSRALANRGHEVTICTGDYEYDSNYAEALGNVNIDLHRSWINRYGFYIMPSLLKLDVRDYDVIHLHCYRSFQNRVVCSKAVKYGIPYVLDAHGSTVDLPGGKRFLRRAYDMLFGLDTLAHARILIAETEVGSSEYLRLGADERKIRVLHPSIDATEFSVLPKVGTFRNEYGIGKKFLVLFVGRIHHLKGIDILVRAVKQLQDKGEEVCLVVVGSDGGYLDELLQLITRLRVFDVLFTGFLDGSNKLAALVDADVLVQPSRNEAGIRPSLEALLCGTPVIVTQDTGAGRKIAEFDGGLLFESGDVDSLARSLLVVRHAPETVQRMTEQAKGYVFANLALERQVAEYEGLYIQASKGDN
jgi:glycosyltransferase involved in cell wall biosynthesis